MLDDDMKAIIVQANLSFAATVNVDSSPNLSPKVTLRPYDDNHLIFANLASPGTVATPARSQDRAQLYRCLFSPRLPLYRLGHGSFAGRRAL